MAGDFLKCPLLLLAHGVDLLLVEVLKICDLLPEVHSATIVRI